MAALAAPGWASLFTFFLPSLSWLSFYPVFPLFIWVAFIAPLRWTVKQTNKRSAFYGGFWLGLAYGGLYCLWFFDLHPLTWLGFSEWESRLVTLAGWALLALEHGVLFGLLWLTYKTLPTRGSRLCLFPLLWVGGFALLNSTPFALPWTLLEYTQVNLSIMRELSGWISGSGLTLLIVFHNVAWAECWPNQTQAGKPSKKTDTAIFLKAFIIPVLLGLFSVLWHQIIPPEKHPWPLPLAIAQANLPIEVIRSSNIPAERIEAAYIAPVESKALPVGTLLAYPEEGVVPGWVGQQFPQRNIFLARLLRLAHAKQIYISVGVSLLDELNNRHYNALALLPPSGQPQAIRFYRKRRLVPFGEYTPYNLGEHLSALLKIWTIDYQAPFEAGQESPLLQAGHARIGGLVCFELIDALPWYQGYAWQYKAQGANLLVNASNLGWFHENPLLEAQFLAIAQMRAAETRLPLVVASNTGVSALISPGGEIIRRSYPSKHGHSKQKQMQPQTQIIFYNGT